MANAAPNQEKPNSPDVPNPPQLLDQNNYPGVCYWHKEDWIKYTQHELDQAPPRLSFLTNKDGIPVTESQIRMFMSAAKQAWNKLYCLQLNPRL